MLQPNDVLRSLDLPRDGTAALTRTVDQMTRIAPDLTTLAADGYRAATAGGVLVAWEAVIDAKLATRRVLALAAPLWPEPEP